MQEIAKFVCVCTHGIAKVSTRFEFSHWCPGMLRRVSWYIVIQMPHHPQGDGVLEENFSKHWLLFTRKNDVVSQKVKFFR
jgi:hypothetical protein